MKWVRGPGKRPPRLLFTALRISIRSLCADLMFLRRDFILVFLEVDPEDARFEAKERGCLEIFL